MASRPIFVPAYNQFQLVRKIDVSFSWHPGFSLSQKRKNIHALHETGKSKTIETKTNEQMVLWPILEVSTKSENALGYRLSAFTLMVLLNNGHSIPLESAFQGSKVFQCGGPYVDLYGKSGFDIKKDTRAQNSGPLQAFEFQGVRWQLEPKTAFYDWLYINAVHCIPDLSDQILEYNGFTDIEFNPVKSVNCQARSCALYVSLYRRGILGKILDDRQQFLELLKQDSFFQSHHSLL